MSGVPISTPSGAPLDDGGGVSLPNPISTNGTAEWETNKPAEPVDEDKGKKPSIGKKINNVRDAVGKAMEKVGDRKNDKGARPEGETLKGSIQRHFDTINAKPTTKDLNTPEARKDRQSLMGRYPQAKGRELIERFERWETDFKRDPVATREKIMAAYAGVAPANFKDHVEPKKSPGLRGSLEQAFRDHSEMDDLAPYVEKYGKNLPHIMRQLDTFDRDLISDPVGTSARLAAHYGAPITQAQQQQYEQKQQHTQARERYSQDVDKAIGMICQHNVLPGFETEEMQNAVADVLMSPDFKLTPGNGFDDLRRAHAQVLASRNTETQAEAMRRQLAKGSKSVKGSASSAGAGPKEKSSPTRAAIKRAIARS